MTDITINEETGLPELPDGYWWQVGKGYYDAVVRGYIRSLDCYYVRVVTKGTDKKCILVDIKPTFLNNYETVRIVETDEFEDEWVLSQPIISRWDGQPAELTKKNILKAAKKALKKFEEITREVDNRALLGDYPPRSLFRVDG